MFRRPGESPLDAAMRHDREAAQDRWERSAAGWDWERYLRPKRDIKLGDLTSLPGLQIKTSAIIREVRAEYNVEHHSQKGMDIHLAFGVINPTGRTVTAGAHFYFANGKPLRDFNNSYCTTLGTVCTWRTLEPVTHRWEYGTVWRVEVVLFMPYFELHMRPGNHNLEFSACVWDEQGRELTTSNVYPFIIKIA